MRLYPGGIFHSTSLYCTCQGLCLDPWLKKICKSKINSLSILLSFFRFRLRKKRGKSRQRYYNPKNIVKKIRIITNSSIEFSSCDIRSDSDKYCTCRYSSFLEALSAGACKVQGGVFIPISNKLSKFDLS